MPSSSRMVEGGCYHLHGPGSTKRPGQGDLKLPRKWKVIALAIALVIVAAFFVYLVR